jgi:hypothetical protein
MTSAERTEQATNELRRHVAQYLNPHDPHSLALSKEEREELIDRLDGIPDKLKRKRFVSVFDRRHWETATPASIVSAWNYLCRTLDAKSARLMAQERSDARGSVGETKLIDTMRLTGAETRVIESLTRYYIFESPLPEGGVAALTIAAGLEAIRAYLTDSESGLSREAAEDLERKLEAQSKEDHYNG